MKVPGHKSWEHVFISSSLQALASLYRSPKMPGDTVDEFGVSALMMAATGGGAEACEAWVVARVEQSWDADVQRDVSLRRLLDSPINVSIRDGLYPISFFRNPHESKTSIAGTAERWCCRQPCRALCQKD